MSINQSINQSINHWSYYSMVTNVNKSKTWSYQDDEDEAEDVAGLSRRGGWRSATVSSSEDHGPRSWRRRAASGLRAACSVGGVDA